MEKIDPTHVHVVASSHPSREQQHEFQELMAEQLRHAPWMLLSVLIHVTAAVVLLLMPASTIKRQDRALVMKPPEVEVPIDLREDPKEETEIEEPELQPELQDVDPDDPLEVSPDLRNYDSPANQTDLEPDWTTAPLGLGGGPTGKFGPRSGGRKRLAKKGRQTAEAIELGLEWLKAHQDDDGMWDADEFMKHDEEGSPCDGDGNGLHDIGVTGLALLAFLGDGSTMNSGPYRGVVKQGARWLRRQQDPDTGLFGTTNAAEFIYNHAIATYAMTEVYGLSDSRLLRKTAQRGIDYLEAHRNPQGVWRYQPRDGDGDTSITGWAVMAYKSAQDFKLNVNKEAFTHATRWFDIVTDPRIGRTGYTKRGGASSRREGIHAEDFPRDKGECMSAVSLLCRFFLGQNPNHKEVMNRQANLILKRLPKWSQKDGSIDHYYWYYASYALYQMGGKFWNDWSKALTKSVVKTQRSDGNYQGSWDPVGAWGEDGGRVYSTAILVLTLEAYYRYSQLVR